ncbi:MAG: 3'(2'),5'-bisphosphate nucleotidase [Gammaproteobacteria bacterium]|nr:MAG: 3'(2'),5'-bisphosphate nucleotidase [Gammaproteobacteria bacterium]RLA54886.1 MAG: 3'(2'),5'-bisphosphate nucleotidase [Gammaproteobacteria bacterium]
MELAMRAGEAILEVYEGEEFDIVTKDDNSPVTAADLAAHKVLEAGLETMIDGVPLLSEEAAIPSFDLRSQWQRYWIIDPLDGTKEFINRNGEFTVNIALVENHIPVMGVVHVPVTGITYAGLRGDGAIRQDKNGHRNPITVRSMQGRGQPGRPVAVVASRRHGAGAVDELLDKLGETLGEVETCNMGSSLKLCLVGEGEADIYPRLAPTMEWDTAAAQAVVEAAGGVVLDINLQPMRYNTKDDLLNPYFYVLGDQNFRWQELLS